jgi:hypothetical protein
MLTFLGIILIVIVAFVALGLLGWLVQALGLIISTLFGGIAGCFGCIIKYIWIIVVFGFLVAVVCNLL